jgi:hypothetical protein
MFFSPEDARDITIIFFILYATFFYILYKVVLFVTNTVLKTKYEIGILRLTIIIVAALLPLLVLLGPHVTIILFIVTFLYVNAYRNRKKSSKGKK